MKSNIGFNKGAKHVLIFTGMNAEKYGAFERYNVELAKQLVANGFQPIFIYNCILDVDAYINDLKQSSAETIILNPNQSYLGLVKSITSLLKLYKPYVVHTHFNPKIVRLVHYISFLYNVPKRFNTFHGMAQSKKMVTKIWMYSLNVLCSKQFAISEAIKKEQLNTFKTSKKKIVTVRLGLNRARFKTDLNKQEIKEKYNLPKQSVLIGNIAFHNPIKGIDVLLKAFSLLNSTVNENIYICQMGSFNSDYTPLLKQKAYELGVSDKILWLGVQNNVPELLQALDIYVQPSRSEGLGLAILEAYFAKLPVVASNVGGIPEIVDNAKGLLFENENHKMLAKQLIKLLNSEALRTEKAENGYKYITLNYNLQAQAKLLIDHYISNN